MTAISLIVAGGAAHLITDASFYDEQGTLIDVRSKVTASPLCQLAIACSGRADVNRIAIRLEAVRDQAQALAKLPDVVTGMRAENAAMDPAGDAAGRNDLMLFVAAWSVRHQRAEGWVISSNRAYLGDGYTPGTLVGVDELTSPPVEFDLFDPLDPCEGARRLLAAQREATWQEGDTNRYVGGFGELTTVTAAGIKSLRVCEWPDAVGGRISR